MMNNRTKALWLPAAVSLLGSMAWRLILQRSFPQSETLLNHAGLPFNYQLLWLAALPFIGAASAHISCRAGGNRSAVMIAVLFPSILMVPLWVVLAIKMHQPSPAQWFGLFSGVLNWIVAPGLALLLGAWVLMGIQSVDTADKNKTLYEINTRTKRFWLPGLTSLTVAMVSLAISTIGSHQARFLANGSSTYLFYIPWLLTLPLCGAAGASLSRRAGGERQACLAAGLFPVIALTTLVGFLVVIGKFTFAKPEWLYFLIALLFGCIIPGGALLLGTMPFVKVANVQAP